MSREYVTEKSYGMVGFSRISGQRRLYGSSITHHTSVALRIHQGQVARELSEERYTADHDAPLIEVILSEMQFAELLTTMNVGYGVPCTIQVHPEHGYIRFEPPVETTRDKFNAEIKADCNLVASRLDELETAIDGGKMSQKERAALLEIVRRVRQDIVSNMPFVESQFEEAMDRVEREAKSAIDGFITHAIHKTGIDAIAKMREIERASSRAVRVVGGKVEDDG